MILSIDVGSSSRSGFDIGGDHQAACEWISGHSMPVECVFGAPHACIEASFAL